MVRLLISGDIMRFYLIAAIAVMIGGAYFCGVQIARSGCRAQIAEIQTATTIKNENIKRNVNDKVIHTTVRDIRSILRDKYTIAE